MALDMEDSNTSWDLSFDDDFDTSSGSLDSATPFGQSQRVVSTSSDEGYKSSSSPSHVKSEKIQQAALRNAQESYTSQQKKKVFQNIGLGHAQVSQSPLRSSTPSSPTAKSPGSGSRPRQANSLVYSDSSNPRWHGRPINTTSSPHTISPHNSPLMSSFARAQDQQERLSSGTLSGLFVRFLRTKSVSSLSVRIASFVIFLLLATLLLNRGDAHIPSVTLLPGSSIVLGTLDDDANLLAARALLQSQEQEQADSRNTEKVVEFEEVETLVQEERRIAHARIANARLRHLKLQQEQEDSAVIAEVAEAEARSHDDSLGDLRRQRSFTKVTAAEENEDLVPLSEEYQDELSLPVEQKGESSLSPFEYTISEEISPEANPVLEEEPDLSKQEELEQAEKMDEDLDAAQEPVTRRKGVMVDEDPEAADGVIEEKVADTGRTALLARLQTARQLAQVEFGELQAERVHDVQQVVPPSQDDMYEEFLQVETDEKEVVRPDIKRARYIKADSFYE